MFTQILYSLVGFILSIGILVSVHEFGHFWMARTLGIKVLRFSIGFGKPLLRWFDKFGIEYVISLIPLGGYVKMLDEREGEVSPLEKVLAFNYKPLWMRMSVVLAGPLFNFLFAILSYWLILMMGVTNAMPIVGTIPKNTAAQFAGFEVHDKIITVDTKKVNNWEEVAVALMEHLGDNQSLVKVESIIYNKPNAKIKTHLLDVNLNYSP
ncbi:MAG: zinc metallopeptidase RseP, partial [Francisellaceae bacterium]|nr:zinc metallopeptidase RseP [Francisellaceae bacterium]